MGLNEWNEHKNADDRMHNRQANARGPTATSTSSESRTHFESELRSSSPTARAVTNNETPVSRPPSPKSVQKGLGKVLALQAKFREWEAKDIRSEGLVFKIRPLAEGGPPPLPKKYHINSGPYALDPNSPYNTEFLTFETSLYDYLVEAGDLPRYEETVIFVDGLKAAVDEKINWLEEKKLVEWKRQSKQTKADHVYSGELLSILEAVVIILIQLSNRW
jgi:hypothetical protein